MQHMKSISKYLVFLMMLNMFSSNVFAQVMKSASAKISATIVEPIVTSKTENSKFGHVAIITAGYIKMVPVGSQASKGSIVLPVSSGTFTAATYDLDGTSGYSYTFAFPPAPLIYNDGVNSMRVASLVSDAPQNAESDLIAGVFVSVTPGNVTVCYN
jgi:hypothetical protein